MQTRSKSDWLTARRCGPKKIIMINTLFKLNLAKVATDYARWVGLGTGWVTNCEYPVV